MASRPEVLFRTLVELDEKEDDDLIPLWNEFADDPITEETDVQGFYFEKIFAQDSEMYIRLILITNEDETYCDIPCSVFE